MNSEKLVRRNEVKADEKYGFGAGMFIIALPKMLANRENLK